jgi:hypothetical protein
MARISSKFKYPQPRRNCHDFTDPHGRGVLLYIGGVLDVSRRLKSLRVLFVQV